MKIVMHELDHCPNCNVVTRMLESKFENDVEIEHRIMENSEIDEFISKGLTSSPVVQIGDEYYTASSRQERENLIETLQIMKENESL